MRGGYTLKSLENHSPVMNRMMLKFRPIAPKPAGGEDISAAAEQERKMKNGRRTKRKYVRVRGRRSTKRKTSSSGRSSPQEKSGIEDDSSSAEKGIVTLQLLPERSESDKSRDNSAFLKFQEKNQHKADEEVISYEESGGGRAALGNVRSVIKTWIIMECVTDRCVDSGVGLGFSDVEKMKNLEADTCPGFVSDGSNRVVWVNEAYRKMVGEAGEINGGGVMVVKEKLPNGRDSFACRARMIQQTNHGNNWNTIIPCDVWRMQFSGFAWKLDVTTALSLTI